MAEKNPIDIQKVIDQGAKVSSLQDLQQKGFSKVKVLDEQAILNLITQAVDRVINTQTAEERERVAAQSRSEFERLLKEQRDMKSRAQLLETSKNELIERVEALQKELSIAMDVQQDTIHKKVQEITASLRKHADEANRRHQSAQQALTESLVEKDQLKETLARLEKERDDVRRSEEALGKDLALEQERSRKLEQARADLTARLENVQSEMKKAREEHEGIGQEHSALKNTLEEKDKEIGELQRELEKEMEKSHAAESKLSTMQWQVKEAQEKMEAGLKEVQQARGDYDRMNSHNIRLMSEVTNLRAEIAKYKSGAAPASAPASAPAPALAQLGTEKGSPSPGKWKFMVTKIPPVPVGKDKEPASAPIDLPGGGDWDLVTVVREPDGSCLCFFRASR
jgi:chromosome segregation ATPase